MSRSIYVIVNVALIVGGMFVGALFLALIAIPGRVDPAGVIAGRVLWGCGFLMLGGLVSIAFISKG